MQLQKKREKVDRGDIGLSIERQCSLLGIHKSGLYYKPKGVSTLNLELMRLIDEHYLEHPDKGARRMHVWLTLDMGYEVSLNRISRFYYDVMCLRSLSPGPHTSKRNKVHKVFPYLLRGMEIERVNQVW
ncbi:MAG: putative transposase, partial [Saprospiraceae bacterium]